MRNYYRKENATLTMLVHFHQRGGLNFVVEQTEGIDKELARRALCLKWNTISIHLKESLHSGNT